MSHDHFNFSKMCIFKLQYLEQFENYTSKFHVIILEIYQNPIHKTSKFQNGEERSNAVEEAEQRTCDPYLLSVSLSATYHRPSESVPTWDQPNFAQLMKSIFPPEWACVLPRQNLNDRTLSKLRRVHSDR
jgi:hypothetical protein